MNRERREREREEEGETERERRGGGDRDRERARRGGGDREREKRRGRQREREEAAWLGVWGFYLVFSWLVTVAIRALCCTRDLPHSFTVQHTLSVAQLC